jgi:hypothetical protein
MCRNLTGQLQAIVQASPWMMGVLRAARACAPPDWWVGGGVLRDLVWDGLHGDFDPARVKDVDLAFYDPFGWSPTTRWRYWLPAGSPTCWAGSVGVTPAGSLSRNIAVVCSARESPSGGHGLSSSHELPGGE